MHVFNIKTATPAEIPSIQEIISQTWEPSYRNIMWRAQIGYMHDEIYQHDALQQQMAAGQRFFLLYENPIPAAFASYSPPEAGTYTLNKLYVKPDYQGKGYGS